MRVQAGTFDIISPVDNWVNRSAVDNYRNPLLEYLIHGLSANTYYQVDVLASNELGTSQPAPGKPFVFLTADGMRKVFSSSKCSRFYLSVMNFFVNIQGPF